MFGRALLPPSLEQAPDASAVPLTHFLLCGRRRGRSIAKTNAITKIILFESYSHEDKFQFLIPVRFHHYPPNDLDPSVLRKIRDPHSRGVDPKLARALLNFQKRWGNQVVICKRCVDLVLPFLECCFCCEQISRFGPHGSLVHNERGNLDYHADCFRCATCDQVITGTFMPKPTFQGDEQSGSTAGNAPRVLRGKGGDASLQFLCERCLPKCPSCRQNLVGKLTKLDCGLVVHTECLLCCECTKPLKAGHFEITAETFSEGGDILNGNNIPRAGGGNNKNLASAEAAFRQWTGLKRRTNMVDGKRTRYLACVECFRDLVQRRTQQECLVEQKRAATERRTSERLHGIERWDEGMRGDSQICLQQLGLVVGGNKNNQSLCFALEQDGKPTLVPVTRHSPQLCVNFHYFVEALRVLTKSKNIDGPVFSLDPSDPSNMDGPFQTKRFVPDTLANTPLGEVLFQADYFLKKFSFGELPDLKIFPSLFDHYAAKSSKSSGPLGGEVCNHRQWFVFDEVHVGRCRVSCFEGGSAPCELLLPSVRVRVEARRLVKDPVTGRYADAAHTAFDDPAVVHARDFTKHFLEVAARVPVVQELLEVARALTLAKYLLTDCE